MDHSQCMVTTTPQWEQHDCPLCPHGLIRGYQMPLTGDQRTDGDQRALSMRYIDSLSCHSPEHARALAGTR